MKNSIAFNRLSVVTLALLSSSALVPPAWAEMELKGSLNLAQIEVNKWTRLDSNFRIQISKNQDQNSYSRREQLAIAFQLQDGRDFPIGLHGRSSIHSEFIRQFPDIRSALSITGDSHLYTPMQAPHSAKKALKLKYQDFYSVDVRASFQVSTDLVEANGLMIGGPELSYVLYGDFRLEVYRKEGSRVLVRASSLKEHAQGAKIFLGPKYELELFGFDPLNNLIEKKINVRAFDLNILSRGQGKIFTIEFEYDLKNQKAQAAYEHLMNPTKWRATDLSVVNPFRSDSAIEVRHVLTGKIDPSETLAHSAGSGVVRNSISETDYVRSSSGVSLNLLAAKASKTNSYLEQDFQFKKGVEDLKFHSYKIGTVALDRTHNVFFGWKERKLLREAVVIFNLDDQHHVNGFEGLSFSYQRSDKRLTTGEIPAIQGQIRKMLPEALHSKINLDTLFDPNTQLATFLDLDLIFSPEALTVMQKLSAREISDVVDSFIQLVREKLASPSERLYFGQLEFANQLADENQRPRDAQGMDTESFYQTHAKKIKEALALILTPTKDLSKVEKQWKALSQLQNDALFKDLGDGIISRLLAQAAQKQGLSIKKLIGFNLQLNAKDRDSIHIVVGDYERPEYTAELIRSRNRILNRNFDPIYFKD